VLCTVQIVRAGVQPTTLEHSTRSIHSKVSASQQVLVCNLLVVAGDRHCTRWELWRAVSAGYVLRPASGPSGSDLTRGISERLTTHALFG